MVLTFREKTAEEGETHEMNCHVRNTDSQAFAQQMNFQMAQLFENDNIQ